MAATMAPPQTTQPAEAPTTTITTNTSRGSSDSSSSSSSKHGAAAAGTPERLPMPSRNPLPLSASQEAQVREIFNARVREKCADDIKAFADCAQGRLLSIPFACRALSNAMNSCMAAHATAAEHDRAREDWFAARAERARERNRRERRKLEQEAFHRDWWGLPPRDPDEVRRELEKLDRAERVGGLTRRPHPPPPGTSAEGRGERGKEGR